MTGPHESEAPPPLLFWSHLRILGLLGRGAQGAVYRAYDPRLELEVALKLSPVRNADRGFDQQHSFSEAQSLARVRHSNVVTVYGVEAKDGFLGMWTELIDGLTLLQLQRNHGLYGAAEAIVMGIQICQAVSAVHGVGLIHRDIKCDNIMRAQGGRLVLMDFGLVQPRLERSSDSVQGTLTYMAPELLRGAPATVQSDIYALGVVLFYLVSGIFPARSPTLDGIRREHESGKLLLLSDVRPDLPQGFVQVVQTAIRPDPSRRYRSAGELEAALLALSGVSTSVGIHSAASQSAFDAEYKILNKLGEGQTGVVYRCRDIELERDVAVKFLRSGSPSEEESSRFELEGKNLASLSHPNVIQVYRQGKLNGSPFLVMELLAGRTLHRRLQSPDQKPPLVEALRIMRDVADGLSALHAKGILHRALSPSSIFLLDGGSAKILDFGFSVSFGELQDASNEAMPIGAMPYVSPEQIAGEPAAVASDMFCFGLLLYELISGRHPFAGEHHMSVLYAIAHRRPEPLAGISSPPPVAICRLVDSCLEKEPGKRPNSLEALTIMSSALEDVAKPDPRLEPPGSQPAEPSREGNPYLSRSMIRRPESFFGRALEVRKIYSRLNSTPPGSISLVGDRKIGKSSLLNYIYMRRNRLQFLDAPESTVMIYFDCQGGHDLNPVRFVQTLLKIAEYEVRGRITFSDCPSDLNGIKCMVERFDRAGYRIVIILDEFEAITTNAAFDLEFYSFLRFLANHYNVGYITSSARNLQVLCHTKEISDSPFFNIFSMLRLRAFLPAEAEALVSAPSSNWGAPLGPYLEEVIDLAGYFPLFLQMVCCHALEHVNPSNPSAKPDFDKISRSFFDEAVLHYRYAWDGFGDHERAALIRVSQEKKLPEPLGHVVEELELRDFVRHVDGIPRLFSTPFRQFVSRQAGSGQSAWARLWGRRRV